MKSPLPTKLGRHAFSLLTLALIQVASPIHAAPSYGETQGTNGWRWRYAPVNSTTEFVDYNTFSGNAWSKDTPENWNWGVFHAANRLQPGINADAVAEFTAPSNGTLKILALRRFEWVKRTGLLGAVRPQTPHRSPRQAFGGNEERAVLRTEEAGRMKGTDGNKNVVYEGAGAGRGMESGEG